MSRGFTVAELITVVVIIGIIASMALPVATNGIRREREIELRERLRKITEAIDLYHEMRTNKSGPVQVAEMEALGANGYPKELDDLVKGLKLNNNKTMKFLRARDLVDPMTGKKEWITLSANDEPDSTSKKGDYVFEVHSTSTALALDGKTHYNEW